MALVMLPCDLPWWSTVQKHLTSILPTTDVDGLIAAMHAIHTLCNIGLDPDEPDSSDPTLFEGLKSFITTGMDDKERNLFFATILPSLTRRALQLKTLRPPNGLHFSLQQHNERTELNREFVASLLAHCFFSTFPKRTLKTHPTLQDFNFTNFFKHLDCNFQRSKLRSFFQYFKIMDKSNLSPSASKIHVSRQVMSGKEWLTIEDWLECGLPLCPLTFKHEGRLDRVRSDHLIICFSSSRVGGPVLVDGSSRECIQFCSCPELLVLLLCSEALEDNEVVTLEGVLQVTRISDPRNKAIIEYLNDPPQLNICCMDGENYSRLPLSQYEEDNVLRELNKALLGFRQRILGYPPPPSTRRLSPIGESFSSTPPEYQDHLHNEDYTPLHHYSDHKEPKQTAAIKPHMQSPNPHTLSARGRFIMLGSSGECLPVSRQQQLTATAPTATATTIAASATATGLQPKRRSASSAYSSCASEPPSPPEVFHSARTSICEEDGDVSNEAKRYSGQLDTPERRSTFAQRLREALCRAESRTSSESSSYAIGISITGSSIEDNEIRMKRGGSRGFMLEDEKLIRGWGEGTNSSDNGMMESSPKRNFGNSSKYSFSTDYSSELEEIYSQLGSWLEEMDVCCSAHASGAGGEQSERQRLRDAAVVQFAGSLLKRTLSESFVGVELGEGGGGGDCSSSERRASRLALAARSLSLELARHKHKLAAQLVSVLGQKREYGCSSSEQLRPVASGNWGCGGRQLGDPQLKLLIQWLAASVAGVPCLVYFTCSHYKLLKLDTVCRVLLDRQWNVGESVGAILRFIRITLSHPNPQDVPSLFEQIIGCEERVQSSDANSSSVSSSDSCLDS